MSKNAELEATSFQLSAFFIFIAPAVFHRGVIMVFIDLALSLFRARSILAGGGHDLACHYAACICDYLIHKRPCYVKLGTAANVKERAALGV